MAPTRGQDMKQKVAMLLFFAVGLFLLYIIFTDEGQEMGSDFSDWIADLIKF